MATFFRELFESIFTPGPTPSLLVATNVAFAALQGLLLILLLATYSIHFLILSFLCAGLWRAINWFSAEITAENEKQEKAKASRELKKGRDTSPADDSGTETEGAEQAVRSSESIKSVEGGLKPMSASTDDVLRKRRSLGEVSGTDSEWDKVENEDEN
jgi:hypothetical protein